MNISDFPVSKFLIRMYKVQVMKTSKLSGSNIPFILNFGPRWRMICRTLRPYSPPVHIYSWLGGPQRPSGRFTEEINVLSLPRFEPRIIKLTPLSLYLLRYPSSQKQSCAEYKAHVTHRHVSIQMPFLFKTKPGGVSIVRDFSFLGILDA